MFSFSSALHGRNGKLHAMGGAPEPGSDATKDPVETAWDEVEARWDDPAAHKAFVGLCHSLGRLPEAGRRYRAVRDGDPERSAEAHRQIDHLLTLAMRTLELTRTPPPTGRGKRRVLYFAVGVAATLIGVALWSLLRR